MKNYPMVKPTVVFSFDFELGWGSVENGLWVRRQAEGVFKKMRVLIPLLLKELDHFEVPVTWALVGGLFTGQNQHQFDHLPSSIKDKLGNSVKSAESDTFDGRDLISILARTRVKHHFACHTYSHVRFNYPKITSSCVNSDLDIFEQLVPDFIDLSTCFVFPQNVEGFYSEVSKYGYKVFRGSELKLMPDNRINYFFKNVFGLPPKSIYSKNNELVCMNGSIFFNTGYKKKYRMPFLKARLNRGLKDIIENGGILHVWCHPFNFVESDGLYELFISFLEEVFKLREKGLINIGMMNDVVE